MECEFACSPFVMNLTAPSRFCSRTEKGRTKKISDLDEDGEDKGLWLADVGSIGGAGQV